MLHKKIPFLRLFVPLCLGIITSLYLHLPLKILIIIIAVTLTGTIVCMFRNDKGNNQWYGIFLSFLLFTCGWFLKTYEKESLTILNDHNRIFMSEISDFPEEKPNSFIIKTKLINILSNDIPVKVKGSILLYHEKDSIVKNLIPGDIVIIKCQPIEITNRGNPGEFNYKFYMESRGFRYYAFTKHSDILYFKRPASIGILNKALIYRSRIVNLYRKRGLDGKNLALAAAITLGEKDLLEDEQKDQFAKAGVMHIMAVSGLHAGVLSMFIFGILFFLKGKFNTVRVIITIVVLWVFSFIAGLSPSVVRASFMFSFLHAGNLLKRKTNSINTMLASAFILAVLWPSVVFDAAFLLSYHAVLFIILFYKKFYDIFNFNRKITDKIWQSTAMSIIAQEGTLPLTLMLFNRFPLLFIFSNLLIIPVSNIIIICGFLTIILSFSPLLSGFTAYCMNITASLAGFLTEITSKLPFASVEDIGLSTPSGILLTVFLLMLTQSLIKRDSLKSIYPIAVFSLFMITQTITSILTVNHNEVIVYNTPTPTIGIKSGRFLHLFCADNTIPAEVKRHCSSSGLKLCREDNISDKTLLVRAGNIRVLIAGNIIPDITGTSPDIIIFTGQQFSSLSADIHPSKIIYTSAFPGSRYNKFAVSHPDCSFYFVKKNGCLRFRI
ncbi:MAG: ComEC/Rec2 family competence protein [Bacteroidales bacterium]|nr:ComEC/Rec2 family competence protein [Bacteroidales bacterium]